MRIQARNSAGAIMTTNAHYCPCEWLNEKKYAVKVDGTTYVGMAVWRLLIDITDREMRILMHALEVYDMDDPKVREEWKNKFGHEPEVVIREATAAHSGGIVKI